MVSKKNKKETKSLSNVPVISHPPSDDFRSRNARLDSLMDRFWDWDPFSHSALFSDRPLERMGLVSRDTQRLFIQPRSDFWENEKEVGLTIDIPGIEKKDIQLNITNNAVEIRAEKKNEKEEKGNDVYRMERSYSGFYRSFPIPSNADPSKVRAKYENGVLRVTIPKTGSPSSRSRSVKVD